MTTFREIPGYPDYRASEGGQIALVKDNDILRILAQRIDKDGYLRVCVSVNGVRYTRFVHQLVALAFLPIDDEECSKEVNHKDGDKTNNDVENLEWSTRSANMQHAIENGLINNVLRVRAYHTKTGEVIVYHSMKSAAKALGLARHQLVRYLTGFPHAKYNGEITLEPLLEDYIPSVREGRSFYVAYDYVSNKTIVADTSFVLALMTGIQAATINAATKAKKMNLIGGYAFKKGEDQTPFPKFDKDEAFASRERYMLQYKN